jgi:hypothetical protein
MEMHGCIDRRDHRHRGMPAAFDESRCQRPRVEFAAHRRAEGQGLRRQRQQQRGQMPVEAGRQRGMGGGVERQARRQLFAAQRGTKTLVIRVVFGGRRRGFHVLTLEWNGARPTTDA